MEEQNVGEIREEGEQRRGAEAGRPERRVWLPCQRAGF